MVILFGIYHYTSLFIGDVGDLKSQVGHIARVEELTVEHVSKIEDRVEEMEEKVSKVDTGLVSLTGILSHYTGTNFYSKNLA